MAVTLYHNPQCSKCRAALELLRARGEEPRIVEYLKTPPDQATLTNILTLLGMEPRQLMRTGEAVYKENNLHNPDLTREELIAAMVKHPKLIERPIAVTEKGAVLGRPPEKVLEVLSSPDGR
ncbi:MAG: arsenate reductase (glutaredoxin) [Magnetococcales bacterium]|nr:arsenate reductase (glutaredoxin) [Magnetococcales bacterium]